MDGYKCLMKSAEISTEGLEEEKPSKFEEWLEKKLGDKMTKVVSVLSAILGIALAVLLFTFLPAFLVGFLKGILPRWGLSLIEGFLKIALFVGYLAVVSLLPDMKRMFQYHGAEHKTIFCYEAGLECPEAEAVPSPLRYQLPDHCADFEHSGVFRGDVEQPADPDASEAGADAYCGGDRL